MTVTVTGLATMHNADVDNNYNVATNPFFTTAIAADTDRVFGIVVEDDTDTTTINEPISSAGLVTEYSNLENTNGFTIRCYNSHTTTGLNLASIDLTANDFFVLVHSDDANLHHMAKITEVKSADASGDMFEFEPKLGNQIAKDTKFMVFKGPTVTNKVLAITCGLIANPHNDVVCAKPLWYFYNDKLDKKNELNHSTKYLVKMMDANSGSSINLSSPTYTGAFVTVNEYRNKIVDYSKFSYNIKTKDLLRTKDDPDNSDGLRQAEGVTKSFDADNYNSSFYNARRNADNINGNTVYTGPNRYLTYATSPNSVNLLPVTLSTIVQESIDGKAGFAETKLIDDGNIYSSKIGIKDKYTVRQEIGSGTFHEWVEIATLGTLGASISNAREYSVKTMNELPSDMTKYINADDEIKIGNKIVRVKSVTSAAFIIYDTSRLETDSIFDTTTALNNLTEGSKIYRRRFNITDNTLLVDFEFNDNATNKLKVVLYSESHKTSEISVSEPDTGINSEYKLLYLSDDSNHRGTVTSTHTGLQYVKGSFIVLNQVFTGEVEKIESKIEDGISYLVIQGRNTFSKVIDPITNKDTLFSEDIIYSSKSPFNDLTSKSATATIAFNSKNVSITAITPSSVAFAKNDKIWAGGFFVGEVKTAVTITSVPTNVELYDYPLHAGTGLAISVENNKKYIYNKALASNPYITSSTDLNGASDKGLFFRTGNRLSDSSNVATFNALVEHSLLAGTSSSDNANAIGYDINKVENILTDSIFSSLINGFEHDTINTLIDFNILSVKENNNNNIVKMAPHLPLTLGRSQPNYANILDAGTYTSLGTCDDFDTGSGTLTTANFEKNIQRIEINSPSTAQKTALMKLQAGDALYTSTDFIGRVAMSLAGTAYIIPLERGVPASLISEKEIFVHHISSISDKKQHDLILTNGQHLHGGKMISLLGPNNEILNYNIYNNADETTYSDTFGSSFFRIISLEKGNIGPTFSYYKGEHREDIDARNLPNVNFYTPELEYNYYATAYKGTDISTVNKTGTGNNNGWPHEQCGIIPITGSNYYDRKRFPNTAAFSLINTFKYVTWGHEYKEEYADATLPAHYSKSSLFHIDPTASRLFLFVNSDKYIYSSTRTDSLLNSASRTLTDYGLLSIGSLKETSSTQAKESIVGNTARVTHLDTSYNHSNILSSDKTLSDLTRFGLMRLTECVYDFFWNPINPEKEFNPDKKIEGEQNNFSFNLENVGTAASYGSIGGGSLVITFNAGHSCAVGDYLVDAFPTYSNNMLVFGKVTNVSSNDVTITNLNYTRESGGTLSFVQTGANIYAIRAADIALKNKITGFGDDRGVVPSGKELNLGKSVLHNAGANSFSADTTGDWYKTFNGGLGDEAGIIAPDGSPSDLLLPIIFETDGTNYTNNPILIRRGISATWATGSKVLGVGTNVSLFSVGDQVVEPVSLGGSQELRNIVRNRVNSIDTSAQTITMAQNIDSSGSANGTNTIVFEMKRDTNTHHNNAFLRWWDKTRLSNFINASSENWSLIKGTVLEASQTDGSQLVSNGMTVRFESLGWGSVKNTTSSKIYTYLLLKNENGDENYKYYGSSARSSSDFDKSNYDGVVIGIKPSIYGGDVGTTISAATDVLGTNNATFKRYSIEFDTRYKFLEFIDLTGCYLVPTVGTRNDGTSVAVSTDSDRQSSSAHNLTTNDIIYVISHEYDTKTSMSNTNTDNCLLTLDKALVDDTHYKIMQPNPVAFWPKSPTEITLNELSSKYTKQANENKMYKNIDSIAIQNGNDALSANFENTSEGIQSMYVVVDIDNLGAVSGSDNTVLKTYSELTTAIGDINKEVCISDGDTQIVTSLSTDSQNGFSLNCKFGQLGKKLKGVLSVSETFELTVAGDISVDDKRALIGSTVNIVKESEDLVEELIEENEVDYSLTKESYPLYASPDFQGASTFAVINYLLSLKDKQIVDDAGTLDVVSTSNKVIKFTFSDENILEFRQVESQFDFYNEVTVYGAGLKSTRKDIRSIKENGRKTLEVFLEELTTQADVDKKAYQLLRIHSTPQSNLELTLPIDTVKNLHVGDVVNCEIKAGNIKMNQYIVLETIHQTSGMIKIKLGRYMIGLDDTFAELFLRSKKDKSYSRKKNFSENENDFDFFSEIKIKELQLTIRKRSLSGSTLGFENELNTNGTQLGFGGSVTHTVLLEEDL